MTSFDSLTNTLLGEIGTVMGRSVVLASRTLSTLNTQSMTRATTSQSQTVSANLTQTTMERDEGGRPVEVRVYELRASDLTIGDPAPGWTLTDGSVSMEIVRVDADCNLRNLILTTRRTP